MKRKQDNLWVMEQAPVGKALLSLAIPTMLGMLVHLIYNITDTFFVGMMGDYVQLAAVSLTMPVTMVTGGLAQLFGGGAPAVISRLLGQGKRESARRASTVSLYLTAAIGAAASIGALIAINPILTAISATGATLPLCWRGRCSPTPRGPCRRCCAPRARPSRRPLAVRWGLC